MVPDLPTAEAASGAIGAARVQADCIQDQVVLINAARVGLARSE